LIKKQLIQRQNLQVRLNQLQLKNEKDRQNLIRDLSHMTKTKHEQKNPEHSQSKSKTKSQDHSARNHSNRNPDTGFEPEI